MADLVKLLVDGLVDGWYTVAVYVAPDGREGVQIPITVGVVQVYALPAFDDDRVRRDVVLHLGKRMPDVTAVDVAEVLCTRRHLLGPFGG